ncbi:MAG TPA: TolC family protein [Bacteroidales bacterium]|nr:TolC family protein [Bacteroidales bacterium]
MKKIILGILLFLTGIVASHAQKVWSLEDCINYALSNNIEIKQQMLNIDYGDQTLLQSKLGMLPDLNGYASHGYNWGQTIDQYTNEFATERVRSNNFYISSQFTVFNGLQQMNQVRKNQLDLLATKYSVDKFMDDVSMSIAAAYLQILYYAELKRVADAQLDITQQQVDRTKKMVEAGTLAKGELLLIEAQLATEELNLINVQNNLDIAYLTLIQLLDLPTTEGFVIEEPDLDHVQSPEAPIGAEAIYEIALDTRPDIKSAELNLQSNEKSLSIARGAQSPVFEFSGSWGTGYSGAAKDYELGIDPFDVPPQLIGYTASTEPMAVYSIPYVQYKDYEIKSFKSQVSDNMNRSIMVNMYIPIFNGWSVRSNIAKAKIGISNATYTLENTKLLLRKVIQQAYADVLAAMKTHTAAEKMVVATTESFKYADQKFNVGMINSVEYNEAKKELTKAQAELIQAKYDYVFKLTTLDFYMGKPLTLKR